MIKDQGCLDSHPSGTGGTVSFFITSRENFSRLVSLFNGNFCTVNKKPEFKNWLNIFNSQYSTEILFIDTVIKPSLMTGWLSGYIDALGPEEVSFTGLIENKEFKSKTLYLTFSIFFKEFYILNYLSVILNIGGWAYKYKI